MWGCSRMMLSFLYWHLLHSSLSWGIKSQGKLYIWKRNCVSEMTVEVGYPLVVLDAILMNLRLLPYNRDGALVPSLLGMLLAPSRAWEKCQWYVLNLNSGCVVYYNSLIPGPEPTGHYAICYFHLVLPFSACIAKTWSGRCNVLKLPPRDTLMQSIFNSTKLPHPEV